MNFHSLILIRENFLPKTVCDYFINHIKESAHTDLQIFDADRTNETAELSWKVDKKLRDVQTTDIKPVLPLAHNILSDSVRNVLNPFYNVLISSSEMPQLLRYGPGGHYSTHIDSESMFNNNGTLEWRKNVNRDISFIYYFNDDFEGGGLVFPKLNVKILPKKGMLVAFPSDHHFEHGVEPVLTGERFAMVCWATIQKTAPK